MTWIDQHGAKHEHIADPCGRTVDGNEIVRAPARQTGMGEAQLAVLRRYWVKEGEMAKPVYRGSLRTYRGK